ncbi:helix-turn-helix domain-containing protein [Lactococcus garvieae]|uniref:helix-turn-helix domain-containing protein n=1 Tax=Lactococcus garvieae TaxID=1363 RepID=UPI00254F6723|nr:helix-turn-helix transcriptional regulator [Lactococcus garvieae]
MTKNKIKELRKSQNITLKKLSELLLQKGIKVNASQISNYEKGTTPRNDKIWVALAEIFNVNLAYLMGISNNKEYIGAPQEHIEDKRKTNIDLITDFLIFLAEYNFLLSDVDLNTVIELLKGLSLNHNDAVDEKKKNEILCSSGKYTLMYALDALRYDEDDDEIAYTGYGYDRDDVYNLLKDISNNLSKR